MHDVQQVHFNVQHQNWLIEAWRGVAALLVLWVHWGSSLGWAMGPMTFGYTGVDLFFVLSGFVFAPTIMGGKQSSRDWIAYAIRRVTRIYPAYLAALVLYAYLVWHRGEPLLYLPEHLLMTHLQSREMVFYYNGVFWSLPSELAFYTLVPALAWWLTHKRQAHWLWPLLLITALAIRGTLIYSADVSNQNWAYVGLHHLPGLLIEFFLGVCVWLAQRQYHLAGWQALGQAALALCGWLLLAAWAEYREGWRIGQLGLAAAICFAMGLDASLRLVTLSRIGLLAILGQWGGRLSYSLYLLHTAWLIPAEIWVERWGLWQGSTLALLGLLSSCWLMHSLIEEPCRKWGRRWAKRLDQPPRLANSQKL